MFYDEENMIDDLETLFKAQLNNEIALVNADKGAVTGEALFLEDIPDEKFIFETLDSRLMNYKGFFVLFGLIDTPIKEAQTGNFLEDVTVVFNIGTFDKGEKTRANTFKKLLRYRRALKQVIMKSPEVFRGYGKPLVGSLKPNAFPYDNSNIILTIGIDIKASITAN